MRSFVAVGALVLTVTVMGGVQAEVLHTLASPYEEDDGFFGLSVSGAGDVDGDGYADLVVGAPGESTAACPDSAGRVYVFSGQTGDTLCSLLSPTSEDSVETGYFGFSVSGAGDVDMDGFDDVIVGAFAEGPDFSPDSAGRAYVFSGRTGDTLYTLLSPNEEEGGCFGWSVSGVGDVDGDEHADVVVGAYKENPAIVPADGGRAYVFSGATGAVLHTLTSPNEQVLGYFGFSVAGAGDVDDDGYGDVVVGAYKEVAPWAAGRAYIFSGSTGAVLYTLASPNDDPLGEFGFSVSGAGDVNDDGHDDVVVGAPLEGPGTSPPNQGRAYVFSGLDGTVLYTLTSPEGGQPFGYFGFSVSCAGDVDDDECDDVIVGAHGEAFDVSPQDAGRAYVFSGRAGTLLSTLTSPNEELDGYFGFSVSGAGDVNGDGRADVVVGGYAEDPDITPENAGRAYVIAPIGVGTNDGPEMIVPCGVELAGPFPNPTTGEARLMARIHQDGPHVVTLTLHDAAGRIVGSVLRATVHGGKDLDVAWGAPAGFSPGMYWWRLTAGRHWAQKPMVIVR